MYNRITKTSSWWVYSPVLVRIRHDCRVCRLDSEFSSQKSCCRKRCCPFAFQWCPVPWWRRRTKHGRRSSGSESGCQSCRSRWSRSSREFRHLANSWRDSSSWPFFGPSVSEESVVANWNGLVSGLWVANHENEMTYSNGGDKTLGHVSHDDTNQKDNYTRQKFKDHSIGLRKCNNVGLFTLPELIQL